MTFKTRNQIFVRSLSKMAEEFHTLQSAEFAFVVNEYLIRARTLENIHVVIIIVMRERKPDD